MNRLQVWLVIDTSISMSGERIFSTSRGVSQLLKVLQIKRNSGKYFEIIIHCVIFNTHPNEVTPVNGVVIDDFVIPDLNVTGHSSLGLALNKIADRLNEMPITENEYIPVIILISDGFHTNTDSFYNAVIERLDSIPVAKRAVRICLTIGSDDEWYDKDVLLQFCKDESHIFNMQRCAGVVRLIKEESILESILLE